MDYLLSFYAKDLMKKNKIKGDSFYLGVGRASPPVHNKMTALVHNRIALRGLNRACPGVSSTHHHKPWGLVDGARSFATREETAYPLPWAFAIASCLAHAATADGWVRPTLDHEPSELSLPHLRAITGNQPKASRMPPLVSEFAYVVHCPKPLGPLPCPDPP